MNAKQIQIYKTLTPAEKLHLAQRLYNDARILKEAGLRNLHPELSDDEIKKKVREIFFYARS